MRTGSPDLDDAEELISADLDGLLRAVALAGAQVRAVAEAAREGVLAPLADLRPRSVVVVHGASGVSHRAAELAVATLASRVDVPVVSGPVLPGWVGPLDVVVVAGDDAGDMSLADAAARAHRRRAEVVVVAPVAGPLRDALGGNGIDLSPRFDIEPRFRFVGFVAALLAVFGALSQVRFTGTAPVLDELADALDEEASADHPGRETFRNRAKSLALRIQDRPSVWSADSPAGAVVARHAVTSLVGLAGVVGAAAELADVSRMSRLLEARSGGAPAADSIFYDPDIDGPPPAQTPRVLVVSTARREWYTRQRVAGLGDVDLVVGADRAEGAPADAGAGVAQWDDLRPAPGDDPVADGPGDVRDFLIVALRVEMAAVYLRLVGNTMQ
ncbi:hypothetical protein IA539_00770 [Gordonia sp. zg691]|uniref:TobH protein n=1 Tax=Gordonia jinghuaiqii TaxID=2758710 RepID=A0A7D7R0U8_9ACTN|nr:hypothetical protein [Gordonia jinghuaiqii]MBD0859749.1 hypothetical protein [Gordonia jinghuaiqii]MCR5976981.1 hypothetical protein [Gordonia jinghuaiqii]QMT00407.1 hypothetical protein H1R19_15990 [Gordonia jinghuaiqii]